jgi:hypothetical protein
LLAQVPQLQAPKRPENPSRNLRVSSFGFGVQPAVSKNSM